MYVWLYSFIPLYESIHFKPSTNIFYLFKNAVIYIYAY